MVQTFAVETTPGEENKQQMSFVKTCFSLFAKPQFYACVLVKVCWIFTFSWSMIDGSVVCCVRVALGSGVFYPVNESSVLLLCKTLLPSGECKSTMTGIQKNEDRKV